MWNKVVSAFIGIFLTATILPVAALAGGSWISGLEIYPNTFNPSNGEKMAINFDMFDGAYVYAYATSRGDGVIYKITDGYEWFNEGVVDIKWDGGYKYYGYAVPSNDYAIEVYVQSQGSVVDNDSGKVTVTGKSGRGSDRNTAPVVSGLSAKPKSIDSENNEATKLSFTVAGDAYIDAYIVDSYSNNVRNFSAYDYTWYDDTTYGNSGTAHSVYWYGGDDNGYPVNDGTYYFYVKATNNYSTDIEWITVTVDNDSTVTPQIKNLNVSPATFDPEDGENTTISFDTNVSAYLQVYIKKNNNVIRSFPDYDYDWKNKGTQYVYWNGRNNSGNIVDDGTYQVVVYAQDGGNKTDSESINVKVLTDNNDCYNKYGDYICGNNDVPTIYDLSVYPKTFDPTDNEKAKFTFKVKENAYLTAYIKQGSNKVITFDNYDSDYYNGSKSSRSISWNGRDDYGDIVDDGKYTFYLYSYMNGESDTETVTVTVDTDNDPNYPYGSAKIKNFKLSPSSKWNPENEDLDIDFELKKSVDDLEITASKSGEKSVKILDDPYSSYSKGNYSYEWDGKDKYNDYVDAGIWKITVKADGDSVSKNITIKYSGSGGGKSIDADIEAYTTKKEFDPDYDEKVSLLFKVDKSEEVDVDLYNGSSFEKSLSKNVDVAANKWYSATWDGTESDGDEADYDDNWRFKITAGNDVKYVNIGVKRDKSSNKAANITRDYTEPVIYDDNKEYLMEISFCLDASADVDLEIYKGVASTGQKVTTILNEESYKSGCHTVKWYVEDDVYYTLSDGPYNYRLTSETTYNNKDTEVGTFVVGNLGGKVKKSAPKKKYDSDACGGYYDLGSLDEDSELCKAIQWAKDQGIFAGYNDGSFKRHDTINRAEVLKVVLEAYDVALISGGGSSMGFKDVNPNAWYMTYVKTAKEYGMLDGYAKGNKAGMSDDINRAEILKFVLEAAEEFGGYDFDDDYNSYVYADVKVSKWYYQYAMGAYKYSLFDTYWINGKQYLKPSQLVERGEVALLLYRMDKAGLL
ncbi:S-layer homology domain-containing protein [Candidatus Peregrinibacteria bacterium]|nr:S-layer homology domain-containing protein [Candidatus Peregrinibacteria bacterium]